MRGAGLFFASSKDDGATYTDAQIVTDNTCECCRPRPGLRQAATPVVVFRNIFEGGVRDHAVVTFAIRQRQEVRRVSHDDWQIAACPHHGPSLTVSPVGTYRVAWYTGGKVRKGLFCARSQDQGRTLPVDPLVQSAASRAQSDAAVCDRRPARNHHGLEGVPLMARRPQSMP